MKIKDLAEQTGLTVYTLRYYEKEGLLDHRHFQRDENNYRNYNEKAIERLKLIKKFQSVGCSLFELKKIFQERDTNSRTNLEIIEWIRQKICEVERKKDEYDQIIEKLNWMLEYKLALVNDPQKAKSLLIDPPFD